MPTKTILLIEDNPDDAALTRRALNKSRVANELVCAADGAEALERLHADAPPGLADLPQLVLLDLKLPKVGGLEVLRRLRAHPRTRLLPVVILTTSKEEEDVAAGYGLGANSYIRKPVDSEQFEQAVLSLGLYWLVVNEAPPASARRP